MARRRVYYISGFDPRGPRFYHQLAQSESARQQSVDGHRYEVSRRRQDGPLATRWTVRAEVDGLTTETLHTVLRWDDVIRNHWPQSRWRVLVQLPRYYARVVGGGVLTRSLQVRPVMFWILLAPLLHGLGSLLVAALLALTLPWAIQAVQPGWIASFIGLAAACGFLVVALRHAEQARLFWLSRILIFMARWGCEAPPEVGQRWSDFAKLITDDLKADGQDASLDEVLLIGHSVGAVAAVCVAHSLLAAGPLPGPPFKLLTLGQVTPLLGLHPSAGWFRQQLQAVGEAPVPWLDVAAPSDALCFGLADPFTACGLPLPARADYRLQSARLDRMFPPADYARARRDLFELHFQYLKATMLPVENDFFKMAWGPQPLRVGEPT